MITKETIFYNQDNRTLIKHNKYFGFERQKEYKISEDDCIGVINGFEPKKEDAIKPDDVRTWGPTDTHHYVLCIHKENEFKLLIKQFNYRDEAKAMRNQISELSNIKRTKNYVKIKFTPLPNTL